MSTHRWWRTVAIKGYSPDVYVSEVQLFASSVRVDGSITLTSNLTPTSGALSDLQDNTFVNAVHWTPAQLKTLTLNWDFGTATTVHEVRWGALTQISNWVRGYGLQYSDDGTNYFEELTVANLAWLSPNALSWSGPRTTWDRSLGALGIGARTGFVFNAPRTTGNLVYSGASTSTNMLWSTLPQSSGTLQFEVTIPTTAAGIVWNVGVGTVPGSTNVVGLAVSGGAATAAMQVGTAASPSGNKINNTAQTAFITPASVPVVAFWLGVVVNFAAGSISFYHNGVLWGIAYAGLSFGNSYISVGTQNGPGNTAAIGVQSFTLNTRVADMQYPIAGATGWDEYSKAVELDSAGMLVDFAPAPVVGSPIWTPSQPTIDANGIFNSTLVPTVPLRARGDYVNYNNDVPWSAQFPLGGLNSRYGTLSGYVSNGGAPAQNRVVVLRMSDYKCMWSGSSDPVTGFWKTSELDPSVEYTAFCIDHTGTWQAIIWDQMVLDPA